MRSIIEAIMRSEGFSEEDIAYNNLTRKEKRALLPNPLMPAEKAFVIETGTDVAFGGHGYQRSKRRRRVFKD